MFEDSLVTSRLEAARLHTRWLAAGSLLLQGSFAALWIVAPLLHPERLQLPASLARPLMVTPRRDPPPAQRHVLSQATATSARDLPRLMAAQATNAPRIQQSGATALPEPAADGINFLAMAGIASGISASLPMASGPGVRVAVTPAEGSRRKEPLQISSGVSAGMLLAPIRPAYPRIAAAAHVSGTVVIAALISRDGEIEDAHVVTGPALLASAALDAARSARYRPYRLNGQPTDVETTITVNFRLGSEP